MKNKHDYLKCEAPICAGYPTENLIWYPDEPICGARPFTKWQTNQKKIAKLAKDNPEMNDFYFTIEMLKRIKNVRKGIKGKNPNTSHKPPVTNKTPLNHGISNIETNKQYVGASW